MDGISQDQLHSGQLVNKWTARKGRLGVTKAMFYKLKANSGTGALDRWHVSKDTFANVWRVPANSRRRHRKRK